MNAFGVLSAKLESEKLLINRAKSWNTNTIIIRPGRLVGAPFTNTDFVKLFNITQGSKQGIQVDKNDVLNGDMDRSDVVNAVSRLLKFTSLPKVVRFSIVNIEGEKPFENEWNQLLKQVVS